MPGPHIAVEGVPGSRDSDLHGRVNNLYKRLRSRSWCGLPARVRQPMRHRHPKPPQICSSRGPALNRLGDAVEATLLSKMSERIRRRGGPGAMRQGYEAGEHELRFVQVTPGTSVQYRACHRTAARPYLSGSLATNRQSASASVKSRRGSSVAAAQRSSRTRLQARVGTGHRLTPGPTRTHVPTSGGACWVKP